MPELDFSFYVMNVKDWGLKYKVIDDFFNNLRLPTVLEVGQGLQSFDKLFRYELPANILEIG